MSAKAPDGGQYITYEIIETRLDSSGCEYNCPGYYVRSLALEIPSIMEEIKPSLYEDNIDPIIGISIQKCRNLPLEFPPDSPFNNMIIESIP